MVAVRVKPNQKGGYTYLNVIGIKPAQKEVLASPPKKQRKVNIYFICLFLQCKTPSLSQLERPGFY